MNRKQRRLAAKQKPQSPQKPSYMVLIKAGETAYAQNRYADALQAFSDALRIKPKDKALKARVLNLLKDMEIRSFNQRLKDIILDLLKTEGLNHIQLSKPWHSLLLCDPAFSELTRLQQQKDYATFCKTIDFSKIKACLRDPYLLEGLSRLLVFDVTFEALLTHLRRYYLDNRENLELEPGSSPFLSALAQYCELNEYIFAVSDEEVKALDAFEQKADLSAYELALYAGYRPLTNLSEVPGNKDHPEVLYKLIKRQIGQYKAEQAAKEAIKNIIDGQTQNEDKTSEKVQEQYEENPYPRWAALPHIPSHMVKNQPLEILIAGCGTGNGVCQLAQLYPKAKITAIDLSLSSLAYAQLKAKEFKFSNIAFFQGNILELGRLNQQFDLIDCSGVLHHMKDPMKGWAILKSLVKPDGKMHIGLYSTAARDDVIAVQKIIKEETFEPTPAGIREFRQTMTKLPDSHAAKPITKRRDYYTTSGCRDLAFHVQEKCYTIPEIAKALNTLDLRFDGFQIPSKTVFEAYKKRFPDDAEMKNLENWAIFEQDHPETFRGMYQFWCRKA